MRHAVSQLRIAMQKRLSSQPPDQLIHTVPKLIAFCSHAFTLEPGDIITTGTPGGVGVYSEPPVFLKPGDEIVVEIESIGRLQNRVGPYLP